MAFSAAFALVLRPRAHLTRYHGVFAPNFKHHYHIVTNGAHPAARAPLAVQLAGCLTYPLNLESVNIYEGTHDVRALILGPAQTRIATFAG